MELKDLKVKLTQLEEQKSKLEVAYSQIVGQINLMRSLITEDENNTKEEKKQ